MNFHHQYIILNAPTQILEIKNGLQYHITDFKIHMDNTIKNFKKIIEDILITIVMDSLKSIIFTPTMMKN